MKFQLINNLFQVNEFIVKGFLVFREKDDLFGFVSLDLEKNHDFFFHVCVLLSELDILEFGFFEGIS